MCGPALAIGLLGSAVSAAGSIAQGNAQAQAAEYNAAVHKNNAIAENRAAAYEASATQRRVEGIVSSQRAAYGKAGVVGGTPLAVQSGTAREGAMDVLATLYSGTMAGNRETAAANLSEMEASSARIGGFLGAGSTLLTGFGNALRFT